MRIDAYSQPGSAANTRSSGDNATRCIVLDRGRIVASCHPDELASNEHVVQAYLGGAEKRELAEVD